MDVRRISAKDVRRKMESDAKALFVCAYDTEDRFHEMELGGAISWPAFQSRLPSIPKDQEIIFYCA